jgi:hypothetical protein
LFDEAVVEVFIFPENEPPSIRDTSRHIPENSKAGVNVVGDAVLGTDDDGDELRYFITGGNLGNRFQINTVTGIISVRTEKLWGEWSLNFEERNIYQLTVKTVDIPKIGFPMSDQCTVTISLQDVNENPVIQDSIRSVRENSEVDTLVGAPLIASDVDDGDKLTFSITDGNFVRLQSGEIIDDVFGISPDSGNIYVKAAVLNYEWKPEYKLTVVVKDLMQASASCIVTINLNNGNDRPRLSSQKRSILENSVGGSLVGTSVLGFDEDALDVLTYTITGGNCWEHRSTADVGEVFSSFPPKMAEPGNANLRLDVRESVGNLMIALSNERLQSKDTFDGFLIRLG